RCRAQETREVKVGTSVGTRDQTLVPGIIVTAWPRRPSRRHPISSVCFCRVRCAMDSRRASCCNGLGTGFVSFWELEPGGNAFGAQLGPLYLCGAVCAPALAARAYFLDTAAVRQVARSAVGPRRPYQLCRRCGFIFRSAIPEYC